MASPKSKFLGVFPAGEIPVPAEQTFKDADGNAINLTNFTPQVRIDGPESTNYATGTLARDIPYTSGRVLYTWSGDEFVDVGKYEMIMWVGDGTNRFGSYLIKWEVYDAPGDLPTV